MSSSLKESIRRIRNTCWSSMLLDVPPGGLEPPTYRLAVSRSIPLSYGGSTPAGARTC